MRRQWENEGRGDQIFNRRWAAKCQKLVLVALSLGRSSGRDENPAGRAASSDKLIARRNLFSVSPSPPPWTPSFVRSTVHLTPYRFFQPHTSLAHSLFSLSKWNIKTRMVRKLNANASRRFDYRDCREPHEFVNINLAKPTATHLLHPLTPRLL